MALFTSYRNLNQVYTILKGMPEMRDIHILCQTHTPPSKILQEFQEYDGEDAVILGTSSFWQGIDLAGEQLTLEIIDKLPFPTPDDPVLHYHEESMGMESFTTYSIPKMLLTLRQGVGRLIRRETDYGLVAILDCRINSKPYGRQVFEALPADCYIESNPNEAWKFLSYARKTWGSSTR